MSVAITATELGGATPAFAQVVVTGLTADDVYTVTGHAGDHEWAVQGGSGISDGEQLVLVDSRVPWGGEVVYRVTVGETVTESDPFELTDPGVWCVFQTLTGDQMVAVEVVTFTDPRTARSRRAFFAVAGRRSPVVRHDVRDSPTGPLTVETDSAATTRALRALLASGAPLVRRQTIGLRDIAPVQIITVGDVTEELVGAVGELRTWSMPWAEIDDPEPDTVLFLFEWDDFDTVYGSSTWNGFDAEWAGSDWDTFDRENWGARLP